MSRSLVARMGLAWGLGLSLGVAGAAGAATLVVPPRPGQVGVSISGTYGTLMQGGDLGGDFSSGSGLAVRLRYRMRFERGFGLTFESHTFDARPNTQFYDASGVPIPQGDAAEPTSLTLGVYGVDFYQMYGTRTKTTRFVSVGAGLVRPSRKDRDGETDFVVGNDGFYASVGVGLERFVWQSWGYELGGRYHAIFHDGRTNHDFQATAGLVFYASL